MQHACTRLPLVELGHHLLISLEVVVIEALDHAAGKDAEHGRFLVVPVSRKGVHAEIPPQRGQEFIGLGQELLVVYQNGHGLARNVPSADTETETLRERLRLPRAVQHGVFQEIGVADAVHPYIRADENVSPAQLGLLIESLRSNDGIDTAHLVTYLPTNFEQIVRL